MTWLRLTTLFAIASCALAGCASKPSATTCSTGIVCPSPLKCAAVQAVCIATSCGDGHVDVGEQCDDGNVMPGDGCSPTCQIEKCGNGVIDPGELCDLGANNGKCMGCSADCMSNESCGNNIIDPECGEVCDNGPNPTNLCNGCNSTCTSTQVCGNGIVDPECHEVCEPSLTPGCSDTCTSTQMCGNGVIDVDMGEECDNGLANNNDNADCRSDCILNRCGDGFVDSMGPNHHEDCDAAGSAAQGSAAATPVESASCNIDCTMDRCGDGKVNETAGEQCDQGSANNNDADCTATCQVNYCGDGHPDTAGPTHIEQCDDGNKIDNDGCSNACTRPMCGNGIVDMGEQCDLGSDGSGNSLNTTTSSCPNCLNAVCGDNLVEAGVEQCDPGAVGTNSATCNLDCTSTKCGDGILNTAAGEQCDDGNNVDTDACVSGNPTSSTCKIAVCGDGKVEAGVEQCDNAGGTDSATCNGTAAGIGRECKLSACGDGYRNVAAGEDCDNGPANGTSSAAGACDSTCHVVGCGNGHLDPGEQCDPGTVGMDSATCNKNCTLPVCGDGYTNMAAGETCDDGTNNGAACPYDTSCSHCNATCNGSVTTGPKCGDTVVQTVDNEQCDGSNLNSATCATVLGAGATGTLACHGTTGLDACLFDASNCARCGDNLVQPTEQCDGTDFNGMTCASFGFHGTGSLTCAADCSAIQTTGCNSTCNDGHLDPGEACDDTSFGGLTCLSYGFHGTGSLTCSDVAGTCTISTASCNSTCDDGHLDADEECDGTNFNGLTCASYGFHGAGSLTCSNTTCKISTASCTSTCNDGHLDADEQCDDTNFNGLTCASYGFHGSGTLTCNNVSGTCTISTASCTSTCNDGHLDPGEACDGTNFDGLSCSSFGFAGGSLTCVCPASTISTMSCNMCGNNMIDAGEQCDGTDLGGENCTNFGYVASAGLACSGTCMYDTSSCMAMCNNNVAEPGEACDGTDLRGQTCASEGSSGTGLKCKSNCSGFDTSMCH